jgi:Ca2+-binding EF-hand superfamily protein
MDDNHSMSLDSYEFEKGMSDFGLGFTSGELKHLFNAFDTANDNLISYQEFLVAIRGPMSQVRQDVVNAAFDSVDKDGNGALEFVDLEHVFSGDRHPEVMAGRMTSQQVVGEWLETFEQHHNAKNGTQADGIVTREEFMEYYANVSCSIDRDDYFVQMINSSWNLDGARQTRNAWTPKGAEIAGTTGGDYRKNIRQYGRMQTKSRSPSP